MKKSKVADDTPLMETPTITINKKSPKTSWLSPFSSHPIILEDKIWPTVSHYVFAKKFEGTMLEEEIRKCKSVLHLKYLSNPKFLITEDNGVFSKKKIYKNGVQEKSDWNKKGVDFLRVATHEKFKQYKHLEKKLKDTMGIKIVDPLDPANSMILEELREEAPLKTDNHLVDFDENIVNNFIACLTNIKSIEGTKKYHLEMLEDVLYNYDKKCVKSVIKKADGILSNWEELPEKTEQTISKINNILKGLNFKPDERIKASSIITSFLSLNPNPLFPPREKLRLVPVNRNYRKI